MKATSILRNFIIVENFCLINRSYLIKDFKSWIFCNVVFITILCSTICAILFDIIYPDEKTTTNLRVIQILSAWETLKLMIGARSRKTFVILNTIDEKCSEVNFNLSSLKWDVNCAIIYLVIATLLDSCGFLVVDVTPSMLLSLFLGTAARDAEMSFYTLLIKAFSLRLSMLDKIDPIIGAKIYGRILIGTANLSGEFYMTILAMLHTTFVKTIVYFVIFTLSNYTINKLVIYLAFLELKAIYSVWMLCSAAAESDSVCQRLTFHLATKIVLDPKINKFPKSSHHRAVSRWLARMTETQPKYITGSIISINLALPLQMIDLSISYTLIIVQIYIAFF